MRWIPTNIFKSKRLEGDTTFGSSYFADARGISYNCPTNEYWNYIHDHDPVVISNLFWGSLYRPNC